MLERKRFSYQALYEIPLFFALLCWINWRFYPDNIGFSDINPHPYWIGILLFSLRYDVFSALFSGFFSAGLYFFIAYSPWDLWPGRDVYVFDDQTFYYLPISFIILSGIIGVVTNRRIAMVRIAENKVELMKRRESPLHDEIQILKKINSELEKKIVTQMSSLISVYEGARRLENVDEGDLYQNMISFFSKALQADQCCIHVLENDQWLIKCHQGFADIPEALRSIPAGRGLIGQAGLKKSILTLREWHQSTAIKDSDDTGTLMAGPLTMGEKGEVIAVFSVQSMPLFKFNSATNNLFVFLLNWGSRSLARAQTHLELTQNAVIDPVEEIYTEKYFHMRLRQEFLLCKRYYLPLSVLLIHLDGLENLPRSRQKIVSASMAEILKKTFRRTDVPAKGLKSGWHYAVLLITCAEKEAGNLLNKLENTIKSIFKAEDGINPRLALSSFTPNHTNEHNLLQEAENKLAA